MKKCLVIALGPLFVSATAVASGTMNDAELWALSHVLDPIIILVQAAMYPIGIILMFLGAIRYAMDDPRGTKTAVKGFLLIIMTYWIPWAADLATGIGKKSVPHHQPPTQYQSPPPSYQGPPIQQGQPGYRPYGSR